MRSCGRHAVKCAARGRLSRGIHARAARGRREAAGVFSLCARGPVRRAVTVPAGVWLCGSTVRRLGFWGFGGVWGERMESC